jgi:hypothetical protein
MNLQSVQLTNKIHLFYKDEIKHIKTMENDQNYGNKIPKFSCKPMKDNVHE